MKIDKLDERQQIAVLRSLLIEGFDGDELRKRLGNLDWRVVEDLKRKLLDSDAEIVRHKPTEHTYAEYCIEQRRNIVALDKVVSDYEKNQNVTGYVAAVRARAELLDRMIKVGQEFGLIERAAEGKGYAAGEAIKGMTNPELRAHIINEITIFNTVQLKFGGGEMPIDKIDPGPLYLPAPSNKYPVKRKQHLRGNVFGGRPRAKGETA